MTDMISIDEGEYAGACLMCTGCAQSLLCDTPDLPGASGDAPAMRAFMRELTELGTIVVAYKEALDADVADLDAVRRALVDADDASSRYFG